MEITRNGVLNRREMEKRAREALAQLGHEVPLHAVVRDLSISDQQLVELARATAVGCNVLILDEPTSSLTRRDVERLFKLIERLKADGLSIVYISHFLEEVQEIADRFIVLRDGRTVSGGDMKTTELRQIINLMVGRDLSDLYPRSERHPCEVVLEVQDLVAGTRLQPSSLQLHKGEVLGIFGLIGSGRTELFRAIFGLDKVRSGAVRVGKFSGGLTQPAEMWKQLVGLVSEDRKNEGLAISRSIAENLILSCPQKVERNGLLYPREVEAASASWIEKLQVRCQGPWQTIGELSGGNQQKIALGRLLHHDVHVLLLDEPTRGIDVGSKKQIYELIDRLALEGKAVIMISSYLPELLGTCDRIAVMRRGILGAPKSVRAGSEQEIMEEATMAGASVQ